MNTGYTISEETISVDDYLRLRGAVGWWPVADAAIEASLGSNLFSVVIVLPDHQGRGLGAALMKRILRRAEQLGGQGSYLGLMCARGVEPFYTRFGFERRPDDGPGMQRILGAGPRADR